MKNSMKVKEVGRDQVRIEEAKPTREGRTMNAEEGQRDVMVMTRNFCTVRLPPFRLVHELHSQAPGSPLLKHIKLCHHLT